jgi:dTDP-4-dehydrorhamnose reductase
MTFVNSTSKEDCPLARNMKHNRRLSVTGASGLLGNKIVELAKFKFEVTPLHRTRPLHPNFLQMDITNKKRVTELFNALKPEIVIHTASETDVDKCEIEKENAWKVNVEGTQNVAEACEEIKAKIICISTDYVFNGEKGLYAEEDCPDPINHYGITKLEAEKRVISNCSNYAILRTSVLYGWHPSKMNFATWVISKLEKNEEIAVVEDHYNTPTLADNLAEMAIEVAERNLQGLFHASGRERINRFELAKDIARTFNLNSDLIKPMKMNELKVWVAKRPRDSSLSTEKIQKQLITKPLNITEELRKLKEERKA